MVEVELHKEDLNEFKEYLVDSNPIITYSFTELINLKQWFHFNLIFKG
jgi:hypothetical protein